MRTFAIISVALCCAMNSSSVSRGQNPSGAADKSTAATQARVLILRPRVKFVKLTLTSHNELEGASEAVQVGFHGVLSRAFEDNGYKLRFDTAQMAEWEASDVNDVPIKMLQDDYDARCSSSFDKNCQMFLARDLLQLHDSKDFDLVVFARGQGFETTKSARLIFPYETGNSQFSLDFSIAVVDMRTGRALYRCGSNVTGDFITAPDSRLSGPVLKCLKPYFRQKSTHQ